MSSCSMMSIFCYDVDFFLIWIDLSKPNWSEYLLLLLLHYYYYCCYYSKCNSLWRKCWAISLRSAPLFAQRFTLWRKFGSISLRSALAQNSSSLRSRCFSSSRALRSLRSHFLFFATHFARSFRSVRAERFRSALSASLFQWYSNSHYVKIWRVILSHFWKFFLFTIKVSNSGSCCSKRTDCHVLNKDLRHRQRNQNWAKIFHAMKRLTKLMIPFDSSWRDLRNGTFVIS